MKHKSVVVVRGTPASGKSTACNQLKDAMLAQGLTVSYLPWDTFHHFVEPRSHLTQKIIMEDTLRLLKVADACLDAGSDLIILDGVFIYPEEIDAIRFLFTRKNIRILHYRLIAQESTLITRNQERAIEDRLPASRIREVVQDNLWNYNLPHETLLDSSKYSPDSIAVLISQAIMQQPLSVNSFANPTTSHLWRLGTVLRYPELKHFEHVDLVWQKNQQQWQSNTFFDFTFTAKEEKELLSLLKQQTVFFKYLNTESHAYFYLHNLAQQHGLRCHEENKWQAPIINIPSKTNVVAFLNQQSTRLKRSLKKARTYHTVTRYSTSGQTEQLWQDALYIDVWGWKVTQQSDMRSLSREDLQYLPGLLSKSSQYHLAVTYDDKGTPGAWSLMINNGSDQWYAAKWGCSNQGREMLMGINCLISHLEMLYCPHTGLQVDLWGRENEFYDQLANEYIERLHLRIMP
ncbi:AAA family ATPase [Xenorhabdus sp. XENO-10]|uniref:AAA family ATPase n=1 Tax=Xenorhabdus yunnanensis TaxID=3025878 RepID=A0ABT5LBD4_9GAMM|nr:AAA family ATPase [Xenorhabdus yunnanensis]MDC9588386.1 AAA family ATPase [Xenorhabdus yunnanensis]